MRHSFFSAGRVPVRLLAVTLALVVSTVPVRAEKPEWAGSGKAQSKQASPVRAPAPRPAAGLTVTVGGYFGEAQRVAVRDYYGAQLRAGKCPPGLAKKGTGCLPPGQAKKWTVGRPLPRDVIFYSVPPAISVQLGVPPAGHRFVRVAADILLIAIGTGMVIDAIEDLAR